MAIRKHQKTVQDHKLGKVLQEIKEKDETTKVYVQLDSKTWILVDKSKAEEKIKNFKKNVEATNLKSLSRLKDLAL